MIETDIEPAIGGKLHELWLYGPASLRGTGRPLFVMLVRAFPVLTVTSIFYWATEAHQNLAVILGVLLADFLIITRGRKLLRGFVGYIIVCAIYAALTSSHWHPAFFANAIVHHRT